MRQQASDFTNRLRLQDLLLEGQQFINWSTCRRTNLLKGTLLGVARDDGVELVVTGVLVPRWVFADHHSDMYVIIVREGDDYVWIDGHWWMIDEGYKFMCIFHGQKRFIGIMWSSVHIMKYYREISITFCRFFNMYGYNILLRFSIWWRLFLWM